MENPATDTMRTTARRLSILLVEDDVNDVDLIRRCLGRTSPQTTLEIAFNGQAAIDYLVALPAGGPRPQLMLCDIKMPIMDGFGLLKWLKREPSWHHLPVVMLSSSTMEKDVATAYELGAVAYLVKPNTLEELQVQMKALVEFWSLNKSLVADRRPLQSEPEN